MAGADVDKDWWRGAVIYQIYPRSFQDSNGDGIGDLLGISQRLPHIASLGVDAIWISPFFKSPMKDFGYDVSDYCDVDPMFGSLADFDVLVSTAHRLGLKVMIDLVLYQGKDIIPLQFLAAVLPKPETLGETTKGNTNIGVIATGEALDGSGEKTFYINNICSHEAAYEETGNQAVSYTTGVPAMIGSAMMVTGKWEGDGVFNMEEMDPDPFMEMLNEHGLPWQVKELDGPVEF